jgi:membrane peptidoglycan carboxypeptidase
MNDGSGTVYKPKNAPSGGFSVQNGPLSLRQSLRESLNLPALSVGRMVGVDSIMDMVAQLGIRRDWGDRARYGLSFALGAGELRLIDMASAYQVVANMGVRVEPTFIHQVIGPDGTIVKDFSKPEGRRVLDEGLAWVFADILKDNTDPRGSWLFGPWTNIGRTAALKTGTTDNLQDVLAIGFTPQRLTAIWMGNADNSIMFGITSAMGPGVLWRDYMKKVMADLPEEWYEKPANIVEAVVCVNPTLRGGNGSGKLPGPGCPRSYRRTEFFVAGTEPKTNDRDVYVGGCYKLVAHFPDWQKFAVKWAQRASSASGGRFSPSICGVKPIEPSGSPSASPGASGSPGQGSAPPATRAPEPTRAPTPEPTPKPTKKP